MNTESASESRNSGSNLGIIEIINRVRCESEDWFKIRNVWKFESLILSQIKIKNNNNKIKHFRNVRKLKKNSKMNYWKIFFFSWANK